MSTKNKSAGTQFTPRGVTQGNVLVCPQTGNPINTIEDGNGVTRLAVDAALTVSNVSVNIDVDYNDDSVAIGDPNSGNVLSINPDGSLDVNVEVDSIDGDNIAISAHPEQLFDSAADTITSTNSEVIYSFTSTDNRTHINKVSGIVSTPSLVLLRINSVVIQQYWTSSVSRNFEFKFDENINVLSGDTLVIEAKVDRLILASYNTFTSLQGYLI